MKQTRIRQLTVAALIAAMYATVTLVFPILSYGAIQCRLAEALTILPVFSPVALPGLAIGCAVSNLIGLGMGANPAGAWDVLLGPLTTLAAAFISYALRGIKTKGFPLLSTLPPVLLNAVVIGAELTLVSPNPVWPLFWFNFATVAIGQFLACVIGGFLLHLALNKSGMAGRLFQFSKI